MHFEFRGERIHIAKFTDLSTRACYALRFADHFVFDFITIDVKIDPEAGPFDEMLSAFRYLRCVDQTISSRDFHLTIPDFPLRSETHCTRLAC